MFDTLLSDRQQQNIEVQCFNNRNSTMHLATYCIMNEW